MGFLRFAAVWAMAGAVLSFAGAASAAEIPGVWRTPQGDHVEVFHCGAALCGRALGAEVIKPGRILTDVKNKDATLRNRPLKGMVFMTDFTGGPAVWTGGKIYDPGDGETYGGSVSLTPEDTLKLKGCALGILCRNQVWTRVK